MGVSVVLACRSACSPILAASASDHCRCASILARAVRPAGVSSSSLAQERHDPVRLVQDKMACADQLAQAPDDHRHFAGQLLGKTARVRACPMCANER
jgi:hypothetical protein